MTPAEQHQQGELSSRGEGESSVPRNSQETLRAAVERIRELRALVEAGTPGPWSEWNILSDGRVEVFMPTGSMDAPTVLEFKDYSDCEECVRPTGDDLLLMLAAVNLLPAVLDMAEGVLDGHHPLAGKSTSTRGYEGYCLHNGDYERVPMLYPCPDAAAVLTMLGLAP